MATNKNGLTKLIRHIGTKKTPLLSIASVPKTTAIVAGESSIKGEIKLNDLRMASLSIKESPRGVEFGGPSSHSSGASSSSGQLSTLLKQTASGGIASVFGGGGLSSITGIGGLITGLFSFFGGGSKSAPRPLVEFRLPTPISESVSVSSRGGTAGASNGKGQLNGNSPLQYQSAEIAQAVKSALLNSSSLNDVIAEI